MAAPGRSTRRTVLANLFVHGSLDKATVTAAHRRLHDLDLFVGDRPLSDDTFDDARRWLVAQQLVSWKRRPGAREFELRLGPGWGCAVGVVLGHHSIRCGIGDARGFLLTDDDGAGVETTAARDVDEAEPSETLDVVANLVRGLQRRVGVADEQLRGLTIALPAPVSEDGRVQGQYVLPRYAINDSVGCMLRAALSGVGLGDVPLSVENDANVSALGEWLLRATPSGPLIVVKVSGGIGAGLLTERGQLHRGALGAAGEIGHADVEPSWLASSSVELPGFDREAPCRRCGGQRHLECYASAHAIVDRVFAPTDHNEYAARHRELIEILESTGHPLNARVTAAVTDAARILARALLPIVDFIDPAEITVTGRMRAAGAVFTDAIDTELVQRRRVPAQHIPITSSTNGWSGVIGAIRMALEINPPSFALEISDAVIGDLREDMLSGPQPWRDRVSLLGPDRGRED